MNKHNVHIKTDSKGIARKVFIDEMEIYGVTDVDISYDTSLIPKVSITFLANSLQTEIDSSIETQQYFETVEDLGLSSRSYNCLKRGGYNTIQSVLDSYLDNSLTYVRNLGRKGYEEIRDKLVELKLIDKGELK